ncbi:hypothetical protein EJ06DRAFT_154220 [Trichodelitschia bisporula]|uniref:Uncharacterized protein n=1 Tax=Trichodelitschia bisporula TaxID=703511 RepID=A0A6G1HP52_9PEZI|nr:hypothetical protein EJ06DRAFT_154220 [Trichodelitschia bisporula]
MVAAQTMKRHRSGCLIAIQLPHSNALPGIKPPRPPLVRVLLRGSGPCIIGFQPNECQPSIAACWQPPPSAVHKVPGGPWRKALLSDYPIAEIVRC